MRKPHEIKTKCMHNCNTQSFRAKVGCKPSLDASTIRGGQDGCQNIT